MSSLFGANYVHCNALTTEEARTLFRSTWYCITCMMPTRQTKRSGSKDSISTSPDQTITFTDMSRTPRPTLRIVMVNESELRRVADGKNDVPAYGFFNTRHAERYRMLSDFANTFQMQLLRTPAGGQSSDSRNPFTSEKVNQSASRKGLAKPDGGNFKRVESQPCLAGPGGLAGLAEAGDAAMTGRKLRLGRRDLPQGRRSSDFDGLPSSDTLMLASPSGAGEKVDGADDENCFLRLHVPHFVGRTLAA
jgi:hypothetical protein